MFLGLTAKSYGWCKMMSQHADQYPSHTSHHTQFLSWQSAVEEASCTKKCERKMPSSGPCEQETWTGDSEDTWPTWLQGHCNRSIWFWSQSVLYPNKRLHTVCMQWHTCNLYDAISFQNLENIPPFVEKINQVDSSQQPPFSDILTWNSTKSTGGITLQCSTNGLFLF